MDTSHILKRLLDILIASTVLLLAWPPLLLAMLAVGLTMGKPVIFRQSRPGLHAKPFILYKLKTMTDARDVFGNLLPDEIRLTCTGKFLRSTSLDELPQLWNVLRGDMSLVGPRPLLDEYLPLYSPEEARRHEVRPGITGWAQVNGRNAISWEERLRMDVWYVDHRSFGLDFKILMLTLASVLKRQGINASGHATMRKFTGSRSNGSA